MKRGCIKLFMSCGVLSAWVLSATAQDQTSGDGDAFASENAIVNTALPFAIGAREARQELRGAFGWATFQEGLVEGVYFRFDPDGYARFSPSPRLDTDVFEVICRPGTLNCIGRKGTMSVFLNGQGALQLGLDDVAEGDVMSLVVGASTLPLPPNVLQPLDARLETLLGSGGELVVKRGEAEFGRFSLNGFAAVSAYLRWITAKQDYSVLPRGWPVPNSDTTSSIGPTVDWQSPIQSRQYSQSGTGNSSLPDENAAVASDVAEVRGELNMLRELLVSRNSPPQVSDPLASIPSSSDPNQTHAAQADQIQALQAQAQALLNEIAMLQTGDVSTPPDKTQSMPATYRANPAPESGGHPHNAQPLVSPTQPLPVKTGATTAMTNKGSDQVSEMTAHLTYLMNEIGLDAATALSLIQSAHTAAPPAQNMNVTLGPLEPTSLPSTSLHNQVVTDILAELRSQLPTTSQTQPMLLDQSVAVVKENAVPKEEFKLLSDYFKSSSNEQN